MEDWRAVVDAFFVLPRGSIAVVWHRTINRLVQLGCSGFYEVFS